jgi:predicted nucleic acid-binding protein
VIHVFDACAMIAYLNGEPGAAAVDALLRDSRTTCFAHAVNLCEVYYDAVRRADVPTAEAAMHDLFDAGVIERDDLDAEFWRAAAQLKVLGRASLADCLCAALARRVRGEVVTSDRREFEPLADAGLCQVRFFR